ncbi:hypothetical protein CEE37_04830 [candidate division LCP-89 bacterium B3_LCP]|uniref:Metal-dependent enzyme n=1 Tax=candidate division LCP-89 bacterium B3_LCP TaxID=2012998 RepID=A0A532V4H0_UNCL8|nr:MAG: hypothetical protein CEE37_04830 [candidate division LCP-89 bacterium B3_LCP]
MKEKAGNNQQPRVGGQAIIEGVMMRSPERVSAAVRLPDGNIEHRTWISKTWSKRNKITGLPVIRGAVSLAEALVLGIRTLNWSADIAMEHEKGKSEKKNGKRSSIGLSLTLVVAFILAIVLFMFVPYQLASLLKTEENQPLFHLVAGSSRILIFLAYVWLISRMKDIQRVFEYHGSEHQAIYTYEKGLELNPENAGLQSRLHPRCGTSFLLIVALSTMLLFIIFDIIVVALWGSYPNVLVRLLVHLPFLPLVAGLSYELLRLSDRYSTTPLLRSLIVPGLALQRLTTRPPDDSQREIAIFALKSALNGDACLEPEEHIDQS